MTPMTDEQKKAHERMQSYLPITTHHYVWKEPNKGSGRQRTAAQAEAARLKIKELKAQGMSMAKIARRLSMSKQTAYFYAKEEE